MVKRATIHVSSRTKKNHPKNEGLRGIKRKQQIQHLQYFTTKLPIAGKAGCNIVLAKLFHFMAHFLAMA